MQAAELRRRAQSELEEALGRCRREYGRIIPEIEDTLGISEVRALWDPYYFGPFRALDALLKHRAEAGDTMCLAYVPVSISHHNVHRLLEVLERDQPDGSLGDAPVPERVRDLLASLPRLQELLDDAVAPRSERATPAQPIAV